jgi:hypothetical protein
MSETTFELADVERLAATLDDVELDDRDLATLHAVFALAGQAAAGEGAEGEVSGFSFQSYTSFKGKDQGQLKAETDPNIGGSGLFDTFSINLTNDPTYNP